MKKPGTDSIRSAVALAVGTLIAPMLTGSSLAQAAAPDAKPEDKGWESIAGAGVTLSRGNTKNFLATVNFDTKRKWTSDEVLFGAKAGYGKATAVNRTDGQPDPENKTDAYVKGGGQYNHLFTEKFYGALRVDALHDDISDVYYRFTLAPLAGYYFIKDAATTFSADLGPAWVVEKVGNDGPRGYLGLRLGERFEHKFAGGARVWQTADITPEITDWDNYVFNFTLGVSAPITKAISVQVVADDTYDHEPTPSRLKNDFKLTAGLAYKF